MLAQTERMMTMEDNKNLESEETHVMGAPGETQKFEMPEPVDDGGDGSEKKGTVTVFGRKLPKKKAVAAGLGIVCALALVGGGIVLAVGSQGQDGEPAVEEQTVAATEDEQEETYAIQVGVKAEGWVEGESSPVIVHVTSESEGIDYYHAYSANEEVALDVPAEGDYEVSFITPVNADGSVYEVPDTQTVQAETADPEDGAKDESGATDEEPELPFEFTLIKAEDVTADELSAVAKAVTEAVKHGDETLTGEDGVAVVELVKTNCKANPNADAEAVEEETEKASESAASEESKAETGTKDSSKGGSSGSGSSNSGSGSGSKGDSGNGGSGSSSQTHTHNWVAQTQTVHHDAQYKTVHHDAQYQTVHHDAQYKNVCVCNGCSAQFDTDNAWGAHSESQLLAGNYSCGSYHTINVVTQQAWDEQVLVQAAYDEQVLVSAAYDETVTTGYKCSSCGATK